MKLQGTILILFHEVLVGVCGLQSELMFSSSPSKGCSHSEILGFLLVLYMAELFLMGWTSSPIRYVSLFIARAVVDLVCVIILFSLLGKSHSGGKLGTVRVTIRKRCVRHHFEGSPATWGKLTEVSPLQKVRVRCMVLLRQALAPGPYLAYMMDETCLEMFWRES